MHRAALELRLTYAPRLGAARDLLVRTPADTTIEQLAQALGEHVGHPAGPDLFSDRVGVLPGDLALADGLVRDGDVLREEGPANGQGRGAASGLEAHLVGGPDAGRRIPLPLGPVTIGRGADAGICVDDPSLSRKHARLMVASGSASIEDFGSSNGTAVDGRRLRSGELVELAPQQQVELGRSLLSIVPADRPEELAARRGGVSIEFNRVPRVRAAGPADERIEIEPPPERAGGVRLPLAASIGPLVLGVAMFAIVHQPEMLMFAALTPVMAVSTFVSDRRGGRKAHATKLARFRARAGQLDGELEAARAREMAARRSLAPDPATLAARATRHLPELWERRRQDPDFLSLRLGTADQPSALTIVFPPGGEAEERATVEARIRASAELPSMPLSVDLLAAGALGISGDPHQAARLARWLVAQAAVLHSPRELSICAALPEGRGTDEWRWLGWLPHVPRSDLAVGRGAADRLLLSLAATAAERRAEREQRFSGRVRERPATLVLIDEAADPSRSLVDDVLAEADGELAVIWLGREWEALPGGCTTVVALERGRAAMDVTWTRDSRHVPDATPDGLDLGIAEEIARALAPVRDVTQSRAAGGLPRDAPLLDVLDLAELSPPAILQRWGNRAPAALRAPLGRSGDGRLTIDLRRDGPHGLVAGTTGAGKSELLQAFVAGLASEQPPTRVSFLFVDYKGGTAFKDCLRLPHTVGMVTDLDEHLTLRVMLSLNAELRRREQILNAAGARDLIELERRSPDTAPPSLVIFVDEFAALKAEVPDFVDGLIDIAQRGRSLGVHLILATQRPGGVVSDKIRANTNLRIALRVQEPGESEDVINDRGAARISKSLPGRGFVRTGHGELTEFQSAFGGAVSPSHSDARRTVVADLPFGDTDPAVAPAPEVVDRPTDLERLVETIGGAAERAGLARPRPPWLPELPATLALDELDPAADPHVVPLGRLDDPRHQRQQTWGVDLERDGSVLVYGASGAGKTTLLRTLAVQLARTHAPRHLHLYALDCAGHGLSVLEALPHTSAVLGGIDEERVTRLLKRLLREIDERGRRFAARGVATLAEFRAVTPPDEWLPRLVLLLDSYAGFLTDFDAVDRGALTAMLPRVMAEGRAAGVHVIATADRRNAVPNAVSSLVSRRVVLRLASEDEYPTLGLDRKSVQGADLPPGRGFVEDTLELQVALADLTEEATQLRELHGAQRATAIPTMPSSVARDALPAPRRPEQPALGIEEAELGPAFADVSDSAFFICGPYRSGRTTALMTLTRSMLLAAPELEVHVLLPRRSALVELAGRATSLTRGDGCLDAVRNLQALVDARSPDQEHPLCVIVIDDVNELADGLPAAALEAVLRRGRDVNVRVLAACETGQARGFSAVLRELRKDGNGLLLEPSPDLDGELLGVRLPRRASLSFPPGRGYLVTGGLPVLVQVAH